MPETEKPNTHFRKVKNPQNRHASFHPKSANPKNRNPLVNTTAPPRSSQKGSKPHHPNTARTEHNTEVHPSKEQNIVTYQMSMLCVTGTKKNIFNPSRQLKQFRSTATTTKKHRYRGYDYEKNAAGRKFETGRAADTAKKKSHSTYSSTPHPSS